jgi:hypothetical protein
MDSEALNMTTKVLGYGRFPFVEHDAAKADSSLLEAMKDPGARVR